MNNIFSDKNIHSDNAKMWISVVVSSEISDDDLSVEVYMFWGQTNIAL